MIIRLKLNSISVCNIHLKHRHTLDKTKKC